MQKIQKPNKKKKPSKLATFAKVMDIGLGLGGMASKLPIGGGEGDELLGGNALKKILKDSGELV